VQSIGSSTFKSVTFRVETPQAGLTFNVQYSLGKGLDNTPMLTQITVQAEADAPTRATSTATSARIRSTCATASTATSSTRRRPFVEADRAALLDGNQIGRHVFNSGLPMNMPATAI
jgi:hypothetical protein